MSELQSERAREQSDRDRAFFERIMHDEELGEENVEAVDSDWADFERLFRYFLMILGNFSFSNLKIFDPK